MEMRFMFKDHNLGLSRYILASYDPGAPVELTQGLIQRTSDLLL